MSAFARNWGEGCQTALLLHCSLAQSGAWTGVAGFLADRCRLIAPDMVGHGRGPSRDPTRDYHDHCTAEALTHLPETPTHLVGHSFGATVALRLALDHPARVASLTLIEPVLFAAAKGRRGWQAHEDAIEGFAPAVHTGDLEAATRLFLGIWGGGTSFDVLPKAQQEAMMRRIWIIAASRPALHDDSAALLPRLPQIACPVLLLEGDRSPPVIAEIQTVLATGTGARRQIVAGAGHMLPITHPEPVAAAIAALIGSSP